MTNHPQLIHFLPKIRRFSVFIALAIPFLAQAQQDSLLQQELQSVTVTAARLEAGDLALPLPLTVIGKSRLQDAQQQLVLSEALGGIPGLFALNTENFAQDVRISIRGYGARSAFGIRGVRLSVDDLPESTPDGQAQVDNLDMGIIDRAEVIRGASSGLYGNAAGGALSLYTEEPPESGALLEGRFSAGSFGLQKNQLKAAQRYKQLGYVLYCAYTNYNGYREHSRSRQLLLNAKAHYYFNKNTRLTLLVNHADSPEADDPGATTERRLPHRISARLAAAPNRQYDAGEALDQQRIGLVLRSQLHPKHHLLVRAYSLWRDFENKLPFSNSGIVYFQRRVLGASIAYTFASVLAGRPYRLQLGLDLDDQSDDRSRFNNLDGTRGELRLQQLETFTNTGAYLLQEWEPLRRFSLRLSLRYDRARVAAADSFLSDGDDSGNSDYNSFSPMAGLSYALAESQYLYANVGRSFETPALSELSANPIGGGFNAELRPQQAYSYELGWKGAALSAVKWELCAFYINSNNELAPYQLDAFPGRTFYRNTGSTGRSGVETSFTWLAAPGLSLSATYTWSLFRYANYSTPADVFDGNTLPGVPQHHANLSAQYFRKNWLLGLQGRYVGALYANDANTAADKPYLLVNLRAGYRHEGKKWTLAPFLGFNNLLNQYYNANIRINAANRQYYEPGPGVAGYGGVVISWATTKNHGKI
jgi:iron complex outermembrane receptor protein